MPPRSRVRSLGRGRAARPAVRLQAALDLGDDHLDGDRVMSSAWYDDIGVAFARLHELQMHCTVVRYWSTTSSSERPRFLTSRRMRRMRRMSASASTNTL